MSEMVERVARAIALAGGTEFDKLPASHGPGFGMRQMYLSMARAAIEAMREPTEAMIAAGDEQSCQETYRRMIDAALKE